MLQDGLVWEVYKFLAPSFFNGIGKILSTRNRKMTMMLQDQEGKVIRIDVLDGPCDICE